MECADKESLVATHAKSFYDLGLTDILSALIEIEDAVLTTIRGVIGLDVVGVDIYLG